MIARPNGKVAEIKIGVQFSNGVLDIWFLVLFWAWAGLVAPTLGRIYASSPTYVVMYLVLARKAWGSGGHVIKRREKESKLANLSMRSHSSAVSHYW